jgi:hypothetical protein
VGFQFAGFFRRDKQVNQVAAVGRNQMASQSAQSRWASKPEKMLVVPMILLEISSGVLTV